MRIFNTIMLCFLFGSCITLEQELTFCTAAQEFSKIVSWIGANVDQIGYATPNLRTDQGS